MFRGSFAELRRAVARVGEQARGKGFTSIKHRMGRSLLELARSGWLARQDPEGNPWTGRNGGRPSLIRTGAMFRSLRLTESAKGFALSVDSKSVGGTTIARIHQWGGRIRVKKSGGKAKQTRGKPMRFATAGGWRSAFEVRIPRTSMLPLGRGVPGPWGDALVKEARAAGADSGLGKGRE